MYSRLTCSPFTLCGYLSVRATDYTVAVLSGDFSRAWKVANGCQHISFQYGVSILREWYLRFFSSCASVAPDSDRRRALSHIYPRA